METTSAIREKLGSEWIPMIYREKVRTQRTRAYQMDVAPQENWAVIQHTLLGIELKVGNRRLSCPDLATARYLRVFARLGCRSLAIPYDITKISTLADEFEISWHKTLLLLDEMTADEGAPVKGRRRASLIREIRQEIEEIGAGALVPEFKQSTKQRNT